MKENLRKFLEEAGKNEELKAKLADLTDKETVVAQTIEIAKQYGFTLTEADFQPEKITELDEAEVDAVAGGKYGWSGIGCIGAGVREMIPRSCGCDIIGAATGCFCIVYGNG